MGVCVSCHCTCPPTNTHTLTQCALCFRSYYSRGSQTSSHTTATRSLQDTPRICTESSHTSNHASMPRPRDRVHTLFVHVKHLLAVAHALQGVIDALLSRAALVCVSVNSPLNMYCAFLRVCRCADANMKTKYSRCTRQDGAKRRST